MPSALRVGDIRAALNERLFPSVTVWNRLEGRPRSLGFERALRAEVRDPLWLLTRQWQLGEFRGSDAGSPVFARLQAGTTRPTKYRPAAHPTEALGPGVPIEATVERRPIPLASGDRALSLDLRLAMGRQWLALTAEIGYRQAFIAAYPIVAPNPADKEDADRCAHPEVWQLFAAVAGRTMDGGALYEHLVAAAGNHAYDGVSDVVPADHEALDKAAGRFVAWFRRLFLQPPLTGEEVSEAWIPPRLEYGFAVSAPEAGGEQVYAADEHHHGRLDWYGVDVAPSETLDPVPGSAATGLPEDEPRTMIPVPISFTGMPNTRWWAFEDRATNLGDFDAGTTDLAKLLFLEFALVYGNDWFVIPQTLPAGVIATIRGLAVTNVFGERFWIEPAGTGSDTSWQRWSMFTVDVDEPGGGAEASLPLLSTAAKIQEGPATEEIVLVRDEVANMVWGVETTIQLPSGESRRGLEAAQETRAFFEARVGPPADEAPANAPIRYRVMSSVPENWIPFIPAHVEGSTREVQLQRAALPRVLEGDREKAVKVQPRASLLREGLDRTPAEPYFVHEEEVPRAGTCLANVFARTRGLDGRVYVWLRTRRTTGRGEGSSGLRFDQVVDVAPRENAPDG